MPRVSIKKKDYKVVDFRKWLIGELAEKKIKQKDLAELFRVTQPAISQKIQKCDWNVKELVILFDYLGTEETKIGSLLKVEDKK